MSKVIHPEVAKEGIYVRWHKEYSDYIKSIWLINGGICYTARGKFKSLPEIFPDEEFEFFHYKDFQELIKDHSMFSKFKNEVLKFLLNKC